MAQISISITKRAAFRDSTQEWANVYVYGSAGAEPTVAAADALIDEVTAIEKTFHSALVTFILGRVWTSGGTIAENHKITEKVLSGIGGVASVAQMDMERAYLMRWPAGLDSRGRKVYLRKWYHTGGNFFTVSPSTGVLGNSTGFSNADRTTMANKADELSRIGTPEVWGLVAESGRTRDGGILSATPPEAHKYLEHHQLGDMWRG